MWTATVAEWCKWAMMYSCTCCISVCKVACIVQHFQLLCTTYLVQTPRKVSSPTLTTFKSRLKTFLCATAFHSSNFKVLNCTVTFIL